MSTGRASCGSVAPRAAGRRAAQVLRRGARGEGLRGGGAARARATDAALCAHWAGLRSVHLGELERAKRELAVLLRELQLYAL